jgi:DNA-binding transcriptional LysR family regulator
LVIQVKAACGPVQFERDRVDLAIRRNDFHWNSDVFAELIVSEEVGPVCAPGLADGSKGLLLRQPLIHTASRADAWEQWFKATKRLPTNKRSSWFEQFYFSIEAAVSGLGLAISPRPFVDDDLETGRLVAPFGFTPNGFGYYLLSRRPFNADKRAASLLAWLRKRLVVKERRKSRRPSRSKAKTKNEVTRNSRRSSRLRSST